MKKFTVVLFHKREKTYTKFQKFYDYDSAKYLCEGMKKQLLKTAFIPCIIGIIWI